MTIKLLLLKSGEDIIADVSEMSFGEEEKKRIVGYFLKQPCVVKMKKPHVTEEKGNLTKAGFEVSLFPWMPLSKDDVIPMTADWLITMVDPIDKLKTMYLEDVVNYGSNNQSSSPNKSSVSDK